MKIFFKAAYKLIGSITQTKSTSINSDGRQKIWDDKRYLEAFHHHIHSFIDIKLEDISNLSFVH
jgi:hypothetical protein